jgi:beta-glucosidase
LALALQALSGFAPGRPLERVAFQYRCLMSDLRRRFPSDFRWGAATSAFQIEGASTAAGKGPSTWDVWESIPGRIRGRDRGASACDHYHRYRQDVALMQALNLNAYRFSVNWARVLPAGRATVNAAGLDFYDRLVDELLAAGIAPLITLYHWDLPAALQFELNGWLSEDLPEVFADYGEVLFRRLGDRVQQWVTLNEPWVSVTAGYFAGLHPPGVQDRRLGYLAGHQLLRAHAAAVERYRGMNPKGRIGLAINSTFAYPFEDGAEDAAAAERALLDFAGWFADPPVFGDYPEALRAAYGDLLPPFSEADMRRLRNSVDFFGINYYFSDIVRHDAEAGPLAYRRDRPAERVVTVTDWPVIPEGLTALLRWFHDRYGLPLAVTENGAAFADQPNAEDFVQDDDRRDYLEQHLAACAEALAAGVALNGYYVWSLLDNLEWSEGFSKRFGIVRCDFATQRRTVKASGRWYAEFIGSR